LALCACGSTSSDPAQADDDVGADAALDAAPAPPDAPDASDDAPPDLPDADPIGPTLEVATWNVERFFDTRCDSDECGIGAYEELPSPQQFEVDVRRVVEGILTLDADVVLLQEIESQECLDAVTALLSDRYPVAVLGETGGAASVDVAVLSKGQLREVVRHRDARIPRPEGGTTTFAREFLEVHLDFGQGRQAVVFSAHFKSKSNDDASRRLAEGTAARKLVLSSSQGQPQALVVMGGDLNDTPGSPPLTALEGDGGLLRAAQELAPEDWTYRWQDQGQAIDHLYMVEGSGSHVPASSQVFRTDPSRAGFSGGDHCALRSSFTWDRPAP
jgi:predicted extracellular nuclease